MSDTTPERILAEIEVGKTERQHMAEDIKELKADVKALVAWSEQVKGGQKVALWITGALGAGFGALIAWALRKMGVG